METAAGKAIYTCDGLGGRFVPLAERGAISIEWGLDGTRLVHISDAVRGGRIAYVCPACRQRLIAMKGSTCRWYFRHVETIEGCPMYSKETRDHYNTKWSLAEALARATIRRLRVRFECKTRPRSDHLAPVERVWVTAWDEVRTEHSLGSVRADIALLREGAVVAIIEVCVSNSISMEKEERLRALGVPWIEIGAGANDDLDEEGKRNNPPKWRWDLAYTLYARRTGPDRWGCPVCDAYEGTFRRVAGDAWSNWIEDIEAAVREGRAVAVWERIVHSSGDEASERLAKLQILDVVDRDHHFQRRVLCLDNHVWKITEWPLPDSDRDTSLADARRDFGAHQRAFLEKLRLVSSVTVDGWERLATPIAPDAVLRRSRAHLLPAWNAEPAVGLVAGGRPVW